MSILKEKIINLLVECDMRNANVLSSKSMAPSCSIDEIAEYISKSLCADEQ